ncbi:hypothetical protein DFJ74DRAFT_654288 [Hyaloraphidium curvatum]|nr:hypothetical protein DFJ74DRAFT_654288 [Hyaloraphidium curvatum]
MAVADALFSEDTPLWVPVAAFLTLYASSILALWTLSAPVLFLLIALASAFFFGGQLVSRGIDLQRDLGAAALSLFYGAGMLTLVRTVGAGWLALGGILGSAMVAGYAVSRKAADRDRAARWASYAPPSEFARRSW